VVNEAFRKELKRIKLAKAIETSVGAWKKKDHPELNSGWMKSFGFCIQTFWL